MIFLKWFDCSRQTLLGQGKAFVNKNSKVQELVGIIQEKMGWPASTPIKLFEVSTRFSDVLWVGGKR
jgi:ubiquitin carboxyl-terminal hydrolase 7